MPGFESTGNGSEERREPEAPPTRDVLAAPKRRKLALSDLEFPGCYSRPMTLAEYEAYEGKVEFFDSGEEIAWIAKVQNDPVKEAILGRFTELMEGVARARGAPIALGGGLEVGARPRNAKRPAGDPLLREQRAEVVNAGIARGLLGERDVAVPADFPAGLASRDRELLRTASEARVVAAADAAASVKDFFSRLADPDS